MNMLGFMQKISKWLIALGVLLVLIACSGFVYLYLSQKPVAATTPTIALTLFSSLDGLYVLDTQSPYFSSEVTVSSGTDSHIEYDIETMNYSGAGSLVGTAYRDTSTTSEVYVSKDFAQGGKQEGCKVSLIFGTSSLYYITESVTATSSDSGCASYRGAQGAFYDEEIHKKGGKVTLPTLTDLGFTAQDRQMFKNMNGDAVAMEEYIGLDFSDEASTTQPLQSTDIPNVLGYSIQAPVAYSGVGLCGFSGSDNVCDYSAFLKDTKGGYWLMTTNPSDNKNGKLLTYITTNVTWKSKLPLAFKNDLKRIGLTDKDVEFKGVYTSVQATSTATTTAKVITSDEAVAIVSGVPEVKAWQALFTGKDGTSPKTGGKPMIVVDSDTSQKYMVHVYEDVPDHLVTFGFWDVDKATGKVVKESN